MMRNLFDQQYQEDALNEKCLQNTCDTTENKFNKLLQDPFNLSDSSLFNQFDERIIHCANENDYLNSYCEAQDIDILQSHSTEQLPHLSHVNSLNQIQSSLFNQSQPIQPSQQHISPPDKSSILNQTTNQPIIDQVQKEPNIKLSNKWKRKLQYILQDQNIHQFSNQHNRNMAKFFVRLFSKYIKSNDQNLLFTSQTQNQLISILKNKCISLNHLQTLFGGEQSKINREFLSRILRTRLRQEVILSKDVQNKKAYLLCSKVYALRCRSKHLIGRLQSQ